MTGPKGGAEPRKIYYAEGSRAGGAGRDVSCGRVGFSPAGEFDQINTSLQGRIATEVLGSGSSLAPVRSAWTALSLRGRADGVAARPVGRSDGGRSDSAGADRRHKGG